MPGGLVSTQACCLGHLLVPSPTGWHQSKTCSDFRAASTGGNMPQRTNGSQKRWPWRQPRGHTSATASHQPRSRALLHKRLWPQGLLVSRQLRSLGAGSETPAGRASGAQHLECPLVSRCGVVSALGHKMPCLHQLCANRCDVRVCTVTPTVTAHLGSRAEVRHPGKAGDTGAAPETQVKVR